MENRSGFISFLKRILLISVLFVTVTIFVYYCSAVRSINQYKYNIYNDIGSVYLTEDKAESLTILSEKEAQLYIENSNLLYTVTIKDNILFLDGQESRNVFIVLSKTEMLWQTKNRYLFKLEENLEYV